MFPLSNTVARRLVGLFFQGHRETVFTEEISKRWQKLSLTDIEGDKFDLSKEKKRPEFVLARKFFTRRAINIEALAKTFRPLWRM